MPCRQGPWNEREPSKRIPNPLLPGLLRFGKGVVCALLWAKLSPTYGAGESGAGLGQPLLRA